MAWAIGASQPDNWAIGASMPTAAPAGDGQVIMIMSKKEKKDIPKLFALLIPFMWLKQDKGNRRQFIRNTIASILGT